MKEVTSEIYKGEGDGGDDDRNGCHDRASRLIPGVDAT